MLIDWFTVGAQIVNFLVLIYLLKRFLYGPILQAMDRREERIAQRLEEAQEERTRAEEEKEEYRQKNRELAEARDEKLREAEEEAEKRRRELMERAREDAEEARRDWRQTVERERESFLRDLRRRTGDEVVRVARKALDDLADADLGSQLTRVFVARLRELDDDQREACAQAAEDEQISVRSSFELDSTWKGQLTKAFRSVCGREAEVEYRVVPEMTFGVVLAAGDLRLSWGTDSYLESLTETVTRLLEESAAGPEEREGEEERGEAPRGGDEGDEGEGGGGEEAPPEDEPRPPEDGGTEQQDRAPGEERSHG